MSASRIKPVNCLYCGHHVDAVSGAGHDRAPKPGDPVACIRCGAVMTCEDGALRPFTEAEAEDLARDERTITILRRVVGCIRILQAGKN